MSRRNRRREPIEVTIDGLSHEGRGVGRIDGKTVFVQGALPGERVIARVIKRRGRFDEAELVEVVQPAARRIEAKCGHFGVCGGCSLQHMDEAYQLEHKQSVLLELLAHHANCEPEIIAEPMRGPQWGYRRKARLGAKLVTAKGGVIVGFRERAKPYVTDCQSCDILDPRIGQHLPALRLVIQSLSVAARLPQVEIAIGDDVVALVLRHLDPLNDDDRRLLTDYASETGFDIYLQPGGLDTVQALQDTTKPPSYEIDGLRLEFAPTAFTQVNASINTNLVARAMAWLELESTDSVVDLFCGLGNFTLPIAARVKAVSGYEGEASLIAQADANAEANGLDNCTFQTANLADPATLASLGVQGCNKLLLDPPRAGALELIEALDLSTIERLVYVSCNPVTFARDSAILTERHGFRLNQCGILDMFPQTAHFESIASFVR